jgi:chaperone modulatory protein CbpM
MKYESTQAEFTGIVIDEHTELTLVELCGACAVQVDSIIALVEEGVLEPSGGDQIRWRFTGLQLRRATVALRLQSALGINPAGVALALQLLDEIAVLRARLRALGN